MGTRKLISEFSVLSFDCYGTLIDWETGILSGLATAAARSPEPVGREAILEAFARHEAAVEAESPSMPYRDVLSEVHQRTAIEWGVEVSVRESREFGLSAGDWEPFPDTREALAYLKRHFKLVILSNVDHANFSRTREKLGVEFDAVFLAEDIGSYKPSKANFAYMLRELGEMGIGKEEILHTAESLFHDHAPAKGIGLAACWIHRRAGKDGFGATPEPESIPRYDFRFENLASMVEEYRKHADH